MRDHELFVDAAAAAADALVDAQPSSREGNLSGCVCVVVRALCSLPQTYLVDMMIGTCYTSACTR